MADPKITLEMSGNDQKLARALTRTEVKIKQLEQKLRAVGTAGKSAADKTGKVGAKAVPNKTLTSLTSFAAGFVSIGAAVGLATKALADFRKAQDEAAQGVKTGEQSRRALAQVAGTQGEFKRLAGISDLLRTEVGLGQIPADTLTFATKSAGLLNKSLFFGGLQEIGFDPLAGVEATQKIQAIFGGTGAGRAGGGTAEQVINKVLAAAGGSPETAERIARSASIAGVDFASIGGQDEALLAIIAELGKTFKTTDIGAERLKTLSATIQAKRGLIDSDLQGLDLINALPRLAEEGRLTSEKGDAVRNLNTFLGSKEAIAALAAITSKRPEISAVRRDVELAERQTGTAGDILAQRQAIVESDPKLRAALSERIALNRVQLQRETQLGPTTLRADQFMHDLERGARDRGSTEFGIFLQKMLLGTGRFFLGDEQFLEDQAGTRERMREREAMGLGPDDAATERAVSEAKFQELIDETRKTNEKLDTLNANSRLAPAELALTPSGSPGIDR